MKSNLPQNPSQFLRFSTYSIAAHYYPYSIGGYPIFGYSTPGFYLPTETTEQPLSFPTLYQIPTELINSSKENQENQENQESESNESNQKIPRNYQNNLEKKTPKKRNQKRKSEDDLTEENDSSIKKQITQNERPKSNHVHSLKIGPFLDQLAEKHPELVEGWKPDTYSSYSRNKTSPKRVIISKKVVDLILQAKGVEDDGKKKNKKKRSNVRRSITRFLENTMKLRNLGRYNHSRMVWGQDDTVEQNYEETIIADQNNFQHDIQNKFQNNIQEIQDNIQDIHQIQNNFQHSIERNSIQDIQNNIQQINQQTIQSIQDFN